MRGWKHNFFIYFLAGNKKKLLLVIDIKIFINREI